MKMNRFAAARGFTLIEMAVSLVVLGLIIVLVLALLPQLTDRVRLDETKTELTAVDEAIVGFALANNRLPCPDTDGDGFEGGGGCGAADQVGLLPFRDMGLPGPALDEARLPLRYGVYRNAGDNADLAELNELFEPALPDALTITPGTVTGCNQTVVPPVTRIVYRDPPVITLTIVPVSGTFQANEYIGFVNLGFSGMSAVQPPPPSAAGGILNPDPPPEFVETCPVGETCTTVPSNCPCGVTEAWPDQPVCTTCTGLTVGNLVTADTSDDQPFVGIRTLAGGASGTLVGYPGGPFQPGNVLQELYLAPNPSYVDPPREIVDPESDDPAVAGYDPTGTMTTNNLLTGVSATVTTVVSKSAHVVSVSGSELIIDFPPDTPFVSGETIYGGTSGAVGTVVSQVTVQTTFNDGEGITSPTGSATILAGSDSGPSEYGTGSFAVDGAVTGSITVGQIITGVDSGTTAEVAAISSDSSSTPAAVRGAIAFSPTISNQTNELDFCQALRNGIAAAGVTGSGSLLHTLNQAGVRINPAWLLASGGVEDADGDGADLAFDGLNEGPGGLDFESPARLRNDSTVSTAVYDDVVAVRQMQVLADRLSCGRNIAAVNALAVDATVQRNIAELAFNGNEQALSLIELSYQAWQQAQLNQDIKEVQIVLSVVTGLISAYELFLDPEGAGAMIAVAVSIAALAVGIGELVVADQAVTSAESTYAGACTTQVAAAATLNQAINAAANALEIAKRADAWGGVQ